MPYTFLQINNYKYQRVNIEHRICPNCNAKVLIANARLLEIYVGSPLDKFKLLRDSRDYLKPKCPNCSEEVFWNSVWSVLY